MYLEIRGRLQFEIGSRQFEIGRKHSSKIEGITKIRECNFIKYLKLINIMTIVIQFVHGWEIL